MRRSDKRVFIIRDSSDLNRVEKNKLGIILHVEGADMLYKHPESVNTLFNLGVRSIGLTWNFKNGLAAGALAKGGLTKKGAAVIRRMEELGIIVDLAHLNNQSTHDVLDIITKPCVISHTNCAHIYQHPRNVDDRLMKRVAEGGGVVCISGVPTFVGKNPTINDVCAHIEHAVNICGEDAVGMGSDFSAMTEEKLIPTYVQSSDFPHLIASLRKRLRRKKLSGRVITKICHANMMRVLTHILPRI